MAAIELSNVHKVYPGNVHVINNVSLKIEAGEFCVFIGPSGCGKSTLLRMVAGLEDITSGELKIENERVNDKPAAKRGVAMVFQSYALYPHMSVRENMGFGLEMQKIDKPEIEKRVTEAGRILQLDNLMERKPKALSGGQRQRVAIGRAIVRKPKVFLFDEPLSNLDASLRVATRIEIARLHREIGGTSMIYVTHDQVEALTLADKIVLLNAGEATKKYGSIAQVGAPLELYHRPRNRFVASFIGSPSMNFIPATVVNAGANGVKVDIGNGRVLDANVDGSRLKAGDKGMLGIRPEHMTLDPNGNLDATVTHCEHMGELSFVYATVPGMDKPLVAKISNTFRGKPGDAVRLRVDAAHAHLFDADDQALPRLAVPDEDLITASAH